MGERPHDVRDAVQAARQVLHPLQKIRGHQKQLAPEVGVAEPTWQDILYKGVITRAALRPSDNSKNPAAQRLGSH